MSRSVCLSVCPIHISDSSAARCKVFILNVTELESLRRYANVKQLQAVTGKSNRGLNESCLYYIMVPVHLLKEFGAYCELGM